MADRAPVFRPFLPRAGALAALLGLSFALLTAANPARAEGWGFFGGLFGGGQPQQVQSPRPDRRQYNYAPPRRRTAAPRPPAREPDVAVAKPAVNASHFVAVFGDSLGQILASGLDDALSDRPDVAVLHDARDSSGLVREDFYNWPRAIAELLAAQPKPEDRPKGDKAKADDRSKAADRAKPDERPRAGHEKIDVAVMMIGANDRQVLGDGSGSYEPGSDQWTVLYARRVTTIAEAFKKANIPLIWVGVPITKDDAFADDMAALNDIYRDVAAKTGATFVDTWEAFSDAKGDFSTFGPDVNGQTVRLRSADGVHFTKAGGRKLAHFVVTQVRRALDRQPAEPLPAADLPTADSKASAPAAAKAAVKPEAGPVEALTSFPAAQGGQLHLATAPRAPWHDPVVETTLVKGETLSARPGRADDASWPQR